MPALPAAPLTLKLELVGTAGASTWANILHFSYTGGPPLLGDINTWINSVETAWTSHAASINNAQTKLTEILATDLNSSSGASSSKTVSHAGTSANDPLSNNASLVILKKIARRYRGGHPKQFLMPQDETQLFDGDTWKASYVTNAGTAWLAFVNACSVVAGSMTVGGEVNVSYYHGFTVVTTPSGRARNVPTLRPAPVIDPIIQYTASPKVGSQRRRTSGG